MPRKVVKNERIDINNVPIYIMTIVVLLKFDGYIPALRVLFTCLILSYLLDNRLNFALYEASRPILLADETSGK